MASSAWATSRCTPATITPRPPVPHFHEDWCDGLSALRHRRLSAHLMHITYTFPHSRIVTNLSLLSFMVGPALPSTSESSPPSYVEPETAAGRRRSAFITLLGRHERHAVV